MTTILIILGIGAVLGVLFMRGSGDSVTEGAAAGAITAGFCMLQLIIPAVALLLGLWLLGKIFG